jgi:hypothetical protein
MRGGLSAWFALLSDSHLNASAAWTSAFARSQLDALAPPARRRDTQLAAGIERASQSPIHLIIVVVIVISSGSRHCGRRSSLIAQAGQRVSARPGAQQATGPIHDAGQTRVRDSFIR